MAFFGKGGGASPGGAPMTSPIPMPRPATNPVTTAPAPGGGGLFPGMSSQARYDMAMSMLQQGMASAAQSNSPIAALLAPLAGSVIGGKIQSKYDTAKAAETDSMIASMMPGGVSPEMQKMLEIASNPDAPDFLRSTAESRIKDAMNPKKGAGRGAGTGGGTSGGKSASGVPLYGEVMGSDGILYGRTKAGSVMPYLGPDGQPFKPAAKGGNSAALDGFDSEPEVPAGGEPAPIIIDGYTIQQVN